MSAHARFRMHATLREQLLDWSSPILRTSASARDGWARLTPLGREIALLLLLKTALLFVLWWAFFREPAAPLLTADPQRVAERLLAPNPAPEVTHADR
jgi:hypothetical protein